MIVSIIIPVYNAGKLVIETLDSIERQTYETLDVIIADDASTDNSVEIINEWLGIKRKFSYRLMVNDQNVGISDNCNRALQLTSGEWIKIIAGDDLLLPDCIERFVYFSKEMPEFKIFVSSIRYFHDTFAAPGKQWPTKQIPADLSRQLILQLRGGFIKAPGVFINKQLLTDVGGFDPKYPFLEDDPLWLRLLEKGHAFFHVPEILIGYRLHDAAISNGRAGKFMNEKFFASYSLFKRTVVFPRILKRGWYIWYLLASMELKVQEAIINRGNTIKSVRPVDRLMLYAIRGLRKMYRIIVNE